MSVSAGCILHPASELVFTEKLISKGSGPAAQASACKTLPEHKKRGGKKEGIREIPGRVKHTTGQRGLASSKSTVWNPRELRPPSEPCPPFMALVWFERSVRVWERSLGIPFFIKGHYYSIALNTQALCLVQRAWAGGVQRMLGLGSDKPWGWSFWGVLHGAILQKTLLKSFWNLICLVTMVNSVWDSFTLILLNRRQLVGVFFSLFYPMRDRALLMPQTSFTKFNFTIAKIKYFLKYIKIENNYLKYQYFTMFLFLHYFWLSKRMSIRD